MLDEIRDPGWFWDTEFMVRAVRRGPAHRRDPGGLRPPLRQDLDRARAARLGPLLRQAAGVPARAARGARAVKAWTRSARARGRASASSPWPWSPTALALVPARCARPGCACWAPASAAASILHDVRFFNLYRRGLAGLRIGDECFLGDECLLDLAEEIMLEAQVTLAERVLVLTHTNVGYRTIRCSAHFPAIGGAGDHPARLLRGRQRHHPPRPHHRPRGLRGRGQRGDRPTCPRARWWRACPRGRCAPLE